MAKADQIARAQMLEQAGAIIVSTGDVQASHQPIKIVFAIGGSRAGVFKVASPQEAFEKATQSLQIAALGAGGNAVVNCSFGYSEVASGGCGSGGFTVHGYGTVVRFA